MPNNGYVSEGAGPVCLKSIVDGDLATGDDFRKRRYRGGYFGNAHYKLSAVAGRDFLLYKSEPLVLLIAKLHESNIDVPFINVCGVCQLVGGVDLILSALVVHQAKTVKATEHQVNGGRVTIIVGKG